MMVSVAPFVKNRASMFLGPSLTFMVVYVWARRNQYVRMSLVGLFTFTAPYLPWVLVGLNMLLGASPVKDLLGIFAGHIYYYFEDIYPRMNNGFKLLETPTLLVSLFGEAQEPTPQIVDPTNPVVQAAPGQNLPGTEQAPGQADRVGGQQANNAGEPQADAVPAGNMHEHAD
jgi:Derlin-2/3